MYWKFMPYTLAISVGGSSATLATEKIFDDLVLVDVDETDGGVHQEVDLSNRKAVWLSSDSMSRRIWRASSELLGVEHLGAS